MKELRNGIKIIGIDHGYSNIKTANTVTPTGITAYTTEPTFGGNILVYDGMYYRMGEGHKPFAADKSTDNDFYLFTLMAIARELSQQSISEAEVHIAAGLPLTWVKTQREDFRSYITRNNDVRFVYRDKPYHIKIVGCSVYPQGYTAVIDRLHEMTGVNMLADIGNGTMNVMYINNKKPVENKCYTEKLGVNQCVISAKNAVMDKLGVKIDDKDTKIHLLSGIVKCPICGAGMYGNKSIKHKKDGTKYKDFFYYGCKHRKMDRGYKYDYKKQINEELLDNSVSEIIIKLVSNPKFAAMMQDKINMQVDTTAIEQELRNYEKQLRQAYAIKSKIIEEIDSLDSDDKHYIKRKADLDNRLYNMYDKIEEIENQLIAARAKKQSIEAEKLTSDNIYKVLIYFEKLYVVMNEAEKRQLIEALVSEIQIYEERQPNGQWLKSIKFKLPIIEEDISIYLDNGHRVECVALITRQNQDVLQENTK